MGKKRPAYPGVFLFEVWTENNKRFIVFLIKLLKFELLLVLLFIHSFANLNNALSFNKNQYIKMKRAFQQKLLALVKTRIENTEAK